MLTKSLRLFFALLMIFYAGSGKTHLCAQFQQAGFLTLDEAFIDMPSYDVHPQSLTMEVAWVSHWFTRLLAVKKEREHDEELVFIADRSPFSAVFYARTGGHFLQPLIEAQIKELEQHNIKIVTVYIRVCPPYLCLLWLMRFRSSLACCGAVFPSDCGSSPSVPSTTREAASGWRRLSRSTSRCARSG